MRPLVANILLRNGLAPDTREIVHEIEKTLRISPKDGTAAPSARFPIQLVSKDIQITIEMAERSCALPRLEQAGIHMTDWLTITEDVNQHCAYLIVSVFPVKPVDSHLVLTRCTNACLTVISRRELAIGVHWESSQAIYRSDVFANSATSMEEMFVLWSTVWFGEFRYPGMEKLFFIHTEGLTTFNGLNVECFVHPTEAHEFVRLLCKCVVDTIGQCSPLPHEHRLEWPIGPEGRARMIELRHEPSYIHANTNVIRVVDLERVVRD